MILRRLQDHKTHLPAETYFSFSIHSPSSFFSYFCSTTAQTTRWRRSSSSYCSSAELYAFRYISRACLGRFLLTLSGRSSSSSYGTAPSSFQEAFRVLHTIGKRSPNPAQTIRDKLSAISLNS